MTRRTSLLELAIQEESRNEIKYKIKYETKKIRYNELNEILYAFKIV